MSTQTEQLFTCPKCGTPNFTKRGLASHNCARRKAERDGQKVSPRPAAVSKATPVSAEDPSAAPVAHPAPGQVSKPGRVLTLAGLDHLPPAFVAGESEDAIMGRQLTMQWERAIGGTKEQVVFGAMMLQLRARVDSARGANSATRGPTTKGTGLKAWLKEHAPKVSEGTAYRLMEIAEGIREEMKLGKAFNLAGLLADAVEDLPEKMAKKRAAIVELIEGRSQRQLLLEFGGKEHARRGGKREAGEKGEEKCPRGMSEADWKRYQAMDEEAREAFDIWRPMLTELRHHGLDLKSWAHLPQLELNELRGLIADLSKATKGGK